MKQRQEQVQVLEVKTPTQQAINSVTAACYAFARCRRHRSLIVHIRGAKEQAKIGQTP